VKDNPQFIAFIFGVVTNKKILKYLAEMPQFKPLTREDIVKLAGSVEVREYNNNMEPRNLYR
jgi:hypothetical protein